MELLSSIALGLIFLLTSLFAWFKYNDSSKARHFAKQGLKYVKIGNLFTATLREQRMELLKSQAIAREGSIFGFSMLNRSTILVADPTIIQTILSKEFTKFSNRRSFAFMNPVFDQGIFFASDEQWKRLRSIITPAFSIGKLRIMKPFMDSTVKTLLGNLDSALARSPVHDVKALFEAFTLETLILAAFGVKVDALKDPNNPIIVNGRALFGHNPSLRDMINFTLVTFAPERLCKLLGVKFLEGPGDFFTQMSIDIMNQKRAESEKAVSPSKATCFIEFCLEAEAEGKKMEESGATDGKKPTKYMTNTEVVAQCVLFFLAGFDTTSTLLTLSAYYLALNPEKQAKVHAEIDSVLGTLQAETPEETDPFKLVSYENLGKFVYLGAAIDEALRLATPAIFVERKASEDTELSNEDGSVKVQVKKGDIIHVPSYSIHRDPKLWTDPEAYRPERFLGEPAHHKYAYLPFGGGPRSCVAQRMALLETKLALLHTLRLYRFEACPQTPVPMQFYSQFDLIVPKEAPLRIVKRT